MIQITELRKSFGSQVAVDGVSFQLLKGETFGLLGPNGAGKTTTINMIVGILQPDSGEIGFAEGLNPRVAAVRRAIGVAPQSLALYTELTAQENLQFFARLYGMRGAQLKERVQWSLEFAGLTDRKRDRVKTFSGGMQRRLNLAAAIVHDPRVIFMDEPTVGVDPQSRNHIFDAIEDLKRQGRTIIYTTHYMEEAQRLCDRVAIMDHGKILDLDSVDALIDRHGGRSVVKADLQRLPADIQSLPAPLDGLSLRFETERPLEEIAKLSSGGVAFQTLELTEPDLETVFLTLTGRSLRD
ncbi:MAG: ABC transporter ATP-binding protein [Pirellulaceae bacterium]|jgi:ABC-2 type transport system ATP-binding protein|nr:ABC transporter ATP-binding protein [Pirellulaceae bacterium]